MDFPCCRRSRRRRTQIASILHKIGTDNQRELVRPLGLPPPVDRTTADRTR